jgi:hypothetical protein
MDLPPEERSLLRQPLTTDIRGDSITSSTRMRFSVHTSQSDKFLIAKAPSTASDKQAYEMESVHELISKLHKAYQLAVVPLTNGVCSTTEGWAPVAGQPRKKTRQLPSF